jgi:sec-independent protein translocase protein TatA
MIGFIPGMSGGPEVIIIIFVIVLLFGGKKLPELARSLGKSLGEFKRGQREGVKAVKDAMKDDEPEAEKPEIKEPKKDD